jgi:hypothetical protein
MRCREVMQDDLHHGELVEIGIEQRMDDHGSRRTASTTDRTARQNPREIPQGTRSVGHGLSDTVCRRVPWGLGLPQRTDHVAMHWPVHPGGLEVHVTRSALSGRRAPGVATVQTPHAGPAYAHKQITKGYKAARNGVALSFTGTLQYWLWRAQCAQPGCPAQERDRWFEIEASVQVASPPPRISHAGA